MDLSYIDNIINLPEGFTRKELESMILIAQISGYRVEFLHDDLGCYFNFLKSDVLILRLDLDTVIYEDKDKRLLTGVTFVDKNLKYYKSTGTHLSSINNVHYIFNEFLKRL